MSEVEGGRPHRATAVGAGMVIFVATAAGLALLPSEGVLGGVTTAVGVLLLGGLVFVDVRRWWRERRLPPPGRSGDGSILAGGADRSIRATNDSVPIVVRRGRSTFGQWRKIKIYADDTPVGSVGTARSRDEMRLRLEPGRHTIAGRMDSLRGPGLELILTEPGEVVTVEVTTRFTSPAPRCTLVRADGSPPDATTQS